MAHLIRAVHYSGQNKMFEDAENSILTFDNLPLSEVRNDVISSAINCTKSNPPAKLQLIAQSQQVAQFVRASISDSTRKSYQSDLAHFLNSGGVIPSPPEFVAQYISTNAEALSAYTLARRLVSIGRAHTSQGLPSPTSADIVKATLRGIRRTYGAKQRQVEPLVKNLIQDIVKDLHGIKGTRDKALLLIGFAGAFRRSELVGLKVNDIEFVEQGLIINLGHSKTDQEAIGRKIAIPFARGNICAVLALKDWLELANIDSGAIFRGVNRHGFISNKQLTTEAVALIIKGHAARIGLDPYKFSGHSLRAGLVTSAAQAGVSNWKIKAQTGHKSDAILNRYVRDARIFIDNAVSELL